jgi:sulfur carrier protein
MVVMNMEIKYSEGHVENLDIKRISVEELLKNLGIDPLEVIVKKDNNVVLEDDIIQGDDNIQIIRVIHGG